MSPLWHEYQDKPSEMALGATPAAQSAQRLPSKSPSAMDRFYKGAISQVEVEKF